MINTTKIAKRQYLQNKELTMFATIFTNIQEKLDLCSIDHDNFLMIAIALYFVTFRAIPFYYNQNLRNADVGNLITGIVFI